MKKMLIVGLAGLGIFVGGCATNTDVHTLSPGRYELCDNTGDDGKANCDGANPEKGIRSVCLPEGRSIVNVENDNLPGQGIIVTCGPKVH